MDREAWLVIGFLVGFPASVAVALESFGGGTIASTAISGVMSAILGFIWATVVVLGIFPYFRKRGGLVEELGSAISIVVGDVVISFLLSIFLI